MYENRQPEISSLRRVVTVRRFALVIVPPGLEFTQRNVSAAAEQGWVFDIKVLVIDADRDYVVTIFPILIPSGGLG